MGLNPSNPHDFSRKQVGRGGKLLLYGARCSSVAQLVEQAAVNRWVAGSSPARGATPSLSMQVTVPPCGTVDKFRSSPFREYRDLDGTGLFAGCGRFGSTVRSCPEGYRDRRFHNQSGIPPLTTCQRNVSRRAATSAPGRLRARLTFEAAPASFRRTGSSATGCCRPGSLRPCRWRTCRHRAVLPAPCGHAASSCAA